LREKKILVNIIQFFEAIVLSQTARSMTSNCFHQTKVGHYRRVFY